MFLGYGIRKDLFWKREGTIYYASHGVTFFERTKVSSLLMVMGLSTRLFRHGREWAENSERPGGWCSGLYAVRLDDEACTSSARTGWVEDTKCCVAAERNFQLHRRLILAAVRCWVATGASLRKGLEGRVMGSRVQR